MKTLFFLFFGFAFGIAGVASEPEWPSSLPGVVSMPEGGESWAASRLRWQRSLKHDAPSELVLLVSVGFPGRWNIVFSEFFVNKHGSQGQWTLTPRDVRNTKFVRRLNEETFGRLKQLISQLGTPAHCATGVTVIVSCAQDGQWRSFVYSRDALPTSLTKIFRLLEFTDLGDCPRNF